VLKNNILHSTIAEKIGLSINFAHARHSIFPGNKQHYRRIHHLKKADKPYLLVVGYMKTIETGIGSLNPIVQVIKTYLAWAQGGLAMTNGRKEDEILRQVADSIVEDFKKEGEEYTPQQEAEFRAFVAGLVNAVPPEEEDIWQTIEILKKTIEIKDKKNALGAVTTFMLQFISGCESTSGALGLLPLLVETREAIKADRFDEASELLMTFLRQSRELVRSM
jgi:hypothetical protein